MSTDVEIKAKITADAAAASKSIAEFNKEIATAKKTMHEAKIGSEEYRKAQLDLAKAQKELSDATAKNTSEHEKSSQAFGVLKDRIAGVVPGFSGAAEGAKGFGTALKALLVNPLILLLTGLVVVMKVVYEAFKNTFEGGQKVEQVFAGIKAVGQSLLDNLDKIGSAIKNVFTFNFSGAIDDIKAVGNAAAGAYNQMADLTAKHQILERMQADNALERVNRQAKLADLRAKVADGELSPAERKKAAQDLLAESKKNAQDDLQLDQWVANNKIAMLQIQKDGAKKNYVEIEAIRTEQRRGEVENSIELKQIGKQVTAAEKAEATERKTAAKEAAAAAKEQTAELKKRLEQEEKTRQLSRQAKRKEQLEEIGFGEKLAKEEETKELAEKKRLADNALFYLQQKSKLAELDILNDQNSTKFKIAKIKADLALELNAIADGDLQKQILAKKAANEIVDIEKEAADAKVKIEKLTLDQKLALTASTFGSLSEIVGKESAAGKALAVSQATITGIQGAMSAYKAMAGIPVVGPALGVVAATAAGVAASANIKRILAVKVPGGSSGGSVPSIAVSSSPIAPQQQSTSLNQSTINSIGNAAQGGVNRAFVLSSDITNNEERNLRINRAARIG